MLLLTKNWKLFSFFFSVLASKQVGCESIHVTSTLSCHPSHPTTQEMSRITKVGRNDMTPICFHNLLLLFMNVESSTKAFFTPNSLISDSTQNLFHSYIFTKIAVVKGNLVDSKATACFSLLMLLIFSWYLTLLSLLFFWLLLIKQEIQEASLSHSFRIYIQINKNIPLILPTY